MLTIHIVSYDSHFDTFEVSIVDTSNDAIVKSLIPATMMPYVAPELVGNTEDLPFDLVGQHFTMRSPLID